MQEFSNGPKKLGNPDTGFITTISGLFIWLIFSLLHHTLPCLETGEYVVSEDYNDQNSGGTWKMNLQGNGTQTHTQMSRAANYGRLLRQWKGFPTSMQQTLLFVVRADVVRMCEKGVRQLRCVKDRAYEVDEAELQLYAQQLRADLAEAKQADLVPVWDDEYSGSSTETDGIDVELDLTRIASDDEREEGVRNSSSMCTQDGINSGDWGEEGRVRPQEDDEEHPQDDEEGENHK